MKPILLTLMVAIGALLAASCASETSSSTDDARTEPSDALPLFDATTDAADAQAEGDCDCLPDAREETDIPDADAEVGEPCLEDSDCRSDFCLDLVAGDDAPGVCSDFCADESDCPQGQDCLLFANSGGDAQRICVALDLCFDDDGDTFGLGPGCRGPDCDDEDPLINLLADEVCDGVDNNCDDNIDENPVGIGTPCDTGFAGQCATGLVECITGGQFCTPQPPTDEVCDAIDNDCDDIIDEDPTDPATFYLDADEDLFGNPDVTVTGCQPPEGYVREPNDCDDANPSIRPGAGEVCNAVDDNCDGVVDELPAVGTIPLYPDADGDGFGTSSAPINACAAPEGFSADGGDCNDGDVSVNPGAAELCNLLDDDCDGAVDEGVTPRWYADRDGDRAGDPGSFIDQCTAPDGYVADASDCNDSTLYIGPGQPELCDGFDNNCNTLTDESGCPSGCAGRTYGGRGYMFCWGDGNQLSYANAETRCAANGMVLAPINSSAENNWIFDTANNLMPTNWDDLWFGARRDASNRWTWANGTLFAESNGTPVAGAFTDWKPGEPNSNSEDCAEMEDYRSSGRLWNDVPCSQGHEYVCEWN
jgi:hypothetical protein